MKTFHVMVFPVKLPLAAQVNSDCIPWCYYFCSVGRGQCHKRDPVITTAQKDPRAQKFRSTQKLSMFLKQRRKAHCLIWMHKWTNSLSMLAF